MNLNNHLITSAEAITNPPTQSNRNNQNGVINYVDQVEGDYDNDRCL